MFRKLDEPALGLSAVGGASAEFGGSSGPRRSSQQNQKSGDDAR